MSVFISELKFEHHYDNLGIGEDKPRLSWRYHGTAEGWTQDSYEIEIQRGAPSALTVERYTVESAENVLVPWPSDALKSSEAVTVRVRSFGNGSETPWSIPQTVEAGLLQPEDWICSLVETSHVVDVSQQHPPTLFRRSFRLTQTPGSARLYITAHGVYEVEVNGVQASDHVLAPGWTVYSQELLYQTFDVSALLQSGSENVIGVHVAEGWYCGRLGFEGGRHNIWGSKTGVIAQLAVTYRDGSTETLGSDASWKYHSSPILNASLYDGETYRMANEQPGWSSPGFDDNAWTKVHTAEHDPKLLRAPDGPPIRATETLPVANIITSPSGKTILDFGQNLVGWVHLRVPRGPRLHEITLIHTEILEHGECATRPLRLAKAKDTLILPDSSPSLCARVAEHWQPRFTFHGFRYVELGNWPEDTVNAEDFKAVVVHTDMKKTGSFESSNLLLNRLHDNVVWSMRGNFVGIPTDCPQRDERLGWTGDLQVFAPTASFLYDCHGMLKTWLRNLVVEQKAGGNGSPPVFSPNVMSIPTFPIAVWGDATILVPWALHLASGDTSILSVQFESMQSWLEKGIPRDDQGLWGATRMQLGDWLDPIAPPDRPGNGSTDAQLVANAYLVKVTDVMSQACHALGYKEKALSYSSQAAALRTAFAAEYITTTGRIISDSQTAIALAIEFGLFPTAAQQAHAAARLEHLICTRSRFKIATGFAGTPILGHALSTTGKTELFYRMLMNKKPPSWLYPVTMGATTIWERWDSMLPNNTINPAGMTSFNHYALGAVADWMHATIGGLRALEPGWKRFRIGPSPGGKLTHAAVVFESPYGTVKSSWKVEGQEYILKIQVPPNTKAEVHVMSADMRIVGSGTHEFRANYVEPIRPSLPPPLPFTTEDDDPDSLT